MVADMGDIPDISCLSINQRVVEDDDESVPPPPSLDSPISIIPYDVMLDIFVYLDAKEIVKILSTCRAFYPGLKDEAVWRGLSARYGVCDLSLFHGRTWFTVYTRLLHTYGPLLGLWASDYPFRGNILDCRIVSGERGVGIVGEIWHFLPPTPMSALRIGEPQLPEYYESFSFILNQDDVAINHWYIHPEQQAWIDEEIHPSLHLLSSTNQSTFVINADLNGAREELDKLILHPEFPSSEANCWYDPNRGLPRIPQEPSPVVDDSRRILGHVRIPHLCTMVTGRTKPSALSIYLPVIRSIDPLHLYDPQHGYRDYRIVDPQIGGRIHDRYYPLHNPPGPDESYQKPGQEGWSAESLEGLWLGPHTRDGTEVFFLEWRGDTKELNAWKMTGNLNIPRGMVSWTLKDVESEAFEPPPPHLARHLPAPEKPYPVAHGIGTVCARIGSPPEHRIPDELVAAIVDNGDIRIRWIGLDLTLRYQRYRRDLASEKAVTAGVRRPAAWA